MTDNNTFIFNEENVREAKRLLGIYEKKQSAVMPLLYLAQSQNKGWLSMEAMDHVAALLEMPKIKVYEVANFYTMFHTKPVGKFIIQVCRTTPCWLCGSEDILQTCEEFLGIGVGETSKDGKFTLLELECIGNCTNSPVMQVNNVSHERLTSKKVIEILKDL